MSLTLLTPPAGFPVALADIKAHLRLTDSAEDALVSAATAAATRFIEARAGLALLTQSWRLTLDAAPEGALRLPIGPVQGVAAVTISGETLDPSAYEVATGLPGRLRAVGAWPRPAESLADVAVDFTAGYGAAADVPAPLIRAVKLLAAQFFETREAAGDERFFEAPAGLDALIAPYRELRL
ncbi:MAG: phage head-tail connector protein [Pseudomonadota bacterium]